MITTHNFRVFLFNLCTIYIKVEKNWNKRETTRRISSHISGNLAGQGSETSGLTRAYVGVHWKAMNNLFDTRIFFFSPENCVHAIFVIPLQGLLPSSQCDEMSVCLSVLLKTRLNIVSHIYMSKERSQKKKKKQRSARCNKSGYSNI